jgi:Zn finger protein HypA/HybF involved in hydrogenase expression
MAMGLVFSCSKCVREISAWDDGQPYYLDESGEKQYAYHPDPQRNLCTGNDSPVLCLDCGADFWNDSAAPTDRCPKCSSHQVIDLWQLDGKKCPYCKAGTFEIKTESIMIS